MIYWVESEFDGGLTAMCGPNAGAMAECWADQRYLGTPVYGQTATLQFCQRARARGDCDANGASVARGLAHSLSADGYRVNHYGSAANWLATVKSALASPAVVIMEVAAGHNLRDSLSGQGEDAGPGLAYHYILLCEYHPGGFSTRAARDLPEGLWCADGDNNVNNPVVGGVRTRIRAGHDLQFYPVSVLAAAQPYDLIAVYPRVALGATSVTIPTGWRDDGTALKAPNGVPVVHG